MDKCMKCGGPGYMGLNKFQCDAKCDHPAPAPDEPPVFIRSTDFSAPITFNLPSVDYSAPITFVDPFEGRRLESGRWPSFVDNIKASMDPHTELALLYKPQPLYVSLETYAMWVKDFEAPDEIEDFRPEDWDPMTDSAGYVHTQTGREISYKEWGGLTATCTHDEMRVAEALQEARAAEQCVKVAREHLHEIAQLVGLDKNGAFPLAEIVERVKALKAAVGSVAFYTVEGRQDLTPHTADGKPLVTPDYLKRVIR